MQCHGEAVRRRSAAQAALGVHPLRGMRDLGCKTAGGTKHHRKIGSDQAAWRTASAHILPSWSSSHPGAWGLLSSTSRILASKCCGCQLGSQAHVYFLAAFSPRSGCFPGSERCCSGLACDEKPLHCKPLSTADLYLPWCPGLDVCAPCLHAALKAS